MPPKKNKQARNAFYFFMLHIRDNSRGKYTRIEDTVNEAGALWEKMSAMEKKPFQDKANVNKVGSGVKMTSLNQNVELILKHEEHKKSENFQMISDIETTIKRLCATNKINQEQFHIMHINNFVYSNTTEKYYPAELALIRFELQDGVLEENIYHTIIHPGPLPLGYSYKAKATAEETHKLPIPNLDEQCNLSEVLNEVHTFLMKSENSTAGNSLPTIFVASKELELVKKVFEQLCYEYEYNINDFKFYSLEQLLFKLRNNITGASVWPTISQSIVELERDVYDYAPEIACQYHEQTDAVVHCSRSIVIRYVYIICDNCCKDLGIQFRPGQHVPKKSLITSISNQSYYMDEGRSTTAVSTTDRSDSYRTMKTTFRDDDDNTSELGNDDGWSVASYSTRGPHGFSTQASSVSEMTPATTAPKKQIRRPYSQSACLMGPSVSGSSVSEQSNINLMDYQFPTLVGRGRGRGRLMKP